MEKYKILFIMPFISSDVLKMMYSPFTIRTLIVIYKKKDLI